MPELALPELQRWMQAAIVHDGTITEALAAPEAAAVLEPGRIERAILPSPTLTATERLDIYHGMYLLRMAEALASDYPALAHFLGEARWAEVVRGYVAAHPSRSYTLNVLGRSLPDWLREAPGMRQRGFCHDLARLEWAVTEAFDAEEAPRLAEAELSAVAPEEWPAVRFVPVPALRLVDLRWNANDWLDSAKDDQHEHPRPRRKAGWVVVFRRNYSVYRRELSRAAFRLLTDLAAGQPLGQALAAAGRRRGAPEAETLFAWFREWAADGLFTCLERPARTAPEA